MKPLHFLKPKASEGPRAADLAGSQEQPCRQGLVREGKGQGSGGGLQPEAAAEWAGGVCGADPAHSPRPCLRRQARCWREEGPPGPPAVAGSRGPEGGLLGRGGRGIQWARGTTLADQSPRGGGATSLREDPELPRDAEEGKKARSRRVHLWSSRLGESTLWAGVGGPGGRVRPGWELGPRRRRGAN